MLEVRFDTEALTRLRFAISPLFEATLSIGALRDPDKAALHEPWSERARQRTRALDLTPVHLLSERDVGYSPDFLNPPPSTPGVELEQELAVMLRTPAEQIRMEVRRARGGRRLPPELTEFDASPRAAIERLAGVMREYWALALAEHWARIRSLLDHDIRYRAALIAEGGTRRLFCELDESVSWRDGVLRIDKDCSTDSLELDERGLLLVPSAFVWPDVLLVSEPPWQPTLMYPARGVGMLWEPERPVPPDAFARLLGATRAALLMALDRPRSTTELARMLGVSSGGVSQHLAVLRDAGLVRSRRAQRVVLYLRSPSGDAFVGSAAS